MNGEERRSEIVKILSNAEKVISASKIAEMLGVSRQVIVQDVALLRANGFEITALARGYIINKSDAIERVFKVTHSDEDAARELDLIVSLGGTVKDVFVYHKIYGIVKAALDIKTHSDVEEFMKGIANGKSSFLKNITSNYHYHTVVAASEEIINTIELELAEADFLAPLQPFEPTEIMDLK